MNILLEDKILLDTRSLDIQPPGLFVTEGDLVSSLEYSPRLMQLWWQSNRIHMSMHSDKRVSTNQMFYRIAKGATTFDNNVLNMNTFDIVKFVADRNYIHYDFAGKRINGMDIYPEFTTPILAGNLIYFYVKFNTIDRTNVAKYLMLKNCRFAVSKVSPTTSHAYNTEFSKRHMLCSEKFKLTDSLFNIQVNFNTIK